MTTQCTHDQPVYHDWLAETDDRGLGYDVRYDWGLMRDWKRQHLDLEEGELSEQTIDEHDSVGAASVVSNHRLFLGGGVAKSGRRSMTH
jgi:hypothetical protein